MPHDDLTTRATSYEPEATIAEAASGAPLELEDELTEAFEEEIEDRRIEFERLSEEKARERLIRENAAHVIVFEKAIWDLVRDLGQTLDDNRERLDFSRIYEDSDRLARSRIEPNDPDRPLRLTFGKSKRSINTAAAHARSYLFGAGPNPTEITAKGASDENAFKEQAILWHLEEQHQRALYKPILRQFIWERCAYPLAVLRHRWVERSGIALNERTGETERTSVYRGMHLENWPLPHVWFSDLDKPTTAQQGAVMWFSERTLLELESEEMILKFEIADEATEDGATVILGIASKTGRFFNLEEVRRRHGIRRLASDHAEDEPTFIRRLRPEQRLQDDRAMGVIGLVEWEGPIPGMDFIVHSRQFHPALMDVFGLDAPRDVASIDGLGRYLSRLFLNTAHTTRGSLIGFGASPYRPARNTALAAAYKPGPGFYGFGIPGLIGHLENSMDKLLNDNMKTAHYNSDPDLILDRKVLVDATNNSLSNEQLKELGDKLGGGLYFFDGSIASNPVHVVQMQPNANWMNETKMLSEEADEQSFITAAIAGQSTGDTATEVSFNQRRADMRALDTEIITGEDVIEEIDRQHLRDLGVFEDVEAFNQNIMRLAGRNGLKASYVFPTLDGLADELIVTHAGQPVVNRERKALIVQRMAQLFISLGTMDPKIAQDELLALELQERNPQRWAAKTIPTSSPKDELRLMALGHFLEPREGEPIIAHLKTHFADLQTLERGETPEALERFEFDAEALMIQLRQHISLTLDLMDTFLEGAGAGVGQPTATGAGIEPTNPGVGVPPLDRATGLAEEPLEAGAAL